MPDKYGDKARLLHILDAIAEIQSYTLGIDYEDFEQNSMMKSACIRQLQVIGEACNHLSEEILSQNSDIPWSEIIGLRVIIVHKYFGIDEKVVWDII